MQESPNTERNRQGRPQDPLFDLGRVVATKAVDAQLNKGWLASCLSKHRRGDWGQVDEHDGQANNESVTNGSRILSVYPTPDGPAADADVVWLITDAAVDGRRLVTTFLYPHEY